MLKNKLLFYFLLVTFIVVIISAPCNPSSLKETDAVTKVLEVDTDSMDSLYMPVFLTYINNNDDQCGKDYCCEDSFTCSYNCSTGPIEFKLNTTITDLGDLNKKVCLAEGNAMEVDPNSRAYKFIKKNDKRLYENIRAAFILTLFNNIQTKNATLKVFKKKNNHRYAKIYIS